MWRREGEGERGSGKGKEGVRKRGKYGERRDGRKLREERWKKESGERGRG